MWIYLFYGKALTELRKWSAKCNSTTKTEFMKKPILIRHCLPGYTAYYLNLLIYWHLHTRLSKHSSNEQTTLRDEDYYEF
jgi:hypothetical protein